MSQKFYDAKFEETILSNSISADLKCHKSFMTSGI